MHQCTMHFIFFKGSIICRNGQNKYHSNESYMLSEEKNSFSQMSNFSVTKKSVVIVVVLFFCAGLWDCWEMFLARSGAQCDLARDEGVSVPGKSTGNRCLWRNDHGHVFENNMWTPDNVMPEREEEREPSEREAIWAEPRSNHTGNWFHLRS